MKILHIISKFSGGGLERRAIQTVKGLCSQPGIEQRIIVYSNNIEYNEVLTIGVEITYIVEKGRITRCNKLRNEIVKYRPDIIHSWLDRFPTEQVYLSLLKKKYGYKYIHGAVCDANSISKLSSIWLGQKVSFMFADVIVSNSRAGLIAKDAPLKKSVIIYNGFDFARIPLNINQNKKHELGILPSCYMVTMCGRIDGSKDWNSFFEVAQISYKEGINAMFVVIGNGIMLDDYKMVVEEKGIDNIVFTGRRADVEELIALSDVCMLLGNPQKHAEGVSNFIMEAMASGKPIIATNGGGTPEIVSEGISGYLVNDNINEAFLYLKELLENNEERNRMGQNAKNEIQNRFSLSIMTNNYVKLYNGLKNNNIDDLVLN